jgi:hypothetical protein
MTDRVETVVIGGGQAGLAVSHELTEAGVEHLVVVPSSGRDVLGVVSAADLVGLETRSPFALRHAVLRARDVDELVDAAARLRRLFLALVDAGISALDVGRPDGGAGYAYVREALAEILAGGTQHGGALLAPLGVRFVVAASGDLPASVRARLDAQVDLDLVPAGGLILYRDARWIPPAMTTPDRSFARAVRDRSMLAISAIGALPRTTLQPAAAGWRGRSLGGVAYVAEQYAAGWRASTSAGTRPVSPAFGWAMTFPAPAGSVALDYAGQSTRTAELLLLAALWIAVLWVTRRPGSR